MRRTVPGILAMLLLSGCASPDTDAPDAFGSGSGQPLASASENWTALGFASSTPINTTQWFNGSFAAADACNPVGCITGAAIRNVDITEHLPRDVPVRLRAILNYTTNQPVFAQPLLMALRAPTPTTYARTDDTATQGHVQIDATIVRREDPIILELLYGAPAGAEAETKYELRLDAWGHHELVPGGVPVAIRLEPGAKIRATWHSDLSSDALVYAPDDSFVIRVEPRNDGLLWDEPVNTGGEYVFVFPETTPWVRLTTMNVTGPLRTLDLERTFSTPQPVAGQPVAWSFTVDRLPLHVGIFETNTSFLVVARENSNAVITSPEGTVAQGPIGCGGTCVQGSEHFASLRSLTGDERNIPGEYDARYEPTQEAGMQVGHFVTHYKR